MCVAAIIHKPVSLSDLKNMEDDNPHGAGVAWAEAGAIRFVRGLTAKQIYDMQQGETMSYPYLLHFRWATHGARVPQLTHPFPTGPRAFFGELDGEAQQVMIHNGVWNDHTEWCHLIGDEIAADLINAGSDTSVAAYFIPEFPDLADEIPWAVAVAAINEAGEFIINLHGRTWLEHEGNSYSNLNWQSTANFWRKYGTTTRSLGWAWDGDTIVEDKTDRVYAKKPDYSGVKDSDTVDMDFEDWTDYVRARYGDEVADAIRRDGVTIRAVDSEEADESDIPSELQDWPDDLRIEDTDLVSEDPSSVNDWLATQAIAAANRKAG